jgi:hypothetical protein
MCTRNALRDEGTEARRHTAWRSRNQVIGGKRKTRIFIDNGFAPARGRGLVYGQALNIPRGVGSPGYVRNGCGELER